MTPELTFLIAAVVGGLAGGAAVALTRRRLELALRMMLDRREEELAHQRERNDILVERIVSLRQAGYEVSRAGQVRQPESAEDKALHRAEQVRRRKMTDDQFIRNAVDRIQRDRPHVTEAAALKEARRLLDETRMEQPPS